MVSPNNNELFGTIGSTLASGGVIGMLSGFIIMLLTFASEITFPLQKARVVAGSSIIGCCMMAELIGFVLFNIGVVMVETRK